MLSSIEKKTYIHESAQKVSGRWLCWLYSIKHNGISGRSLSCNQWIAGFIPVVVSLSKILFGCLYFGPLRSIYRSGPTPAYDMANCVWKGHLPPDSGTMTFKWYWKGNSLTEIENFGLPFLLNPVKKLLIASKHLCLCLYLVKMLLNLLCEGHFVLPHNFS